MLKNLITKLIERRMNLSLKPPTANISTGYRAVSDNNLSAIAKIVGPAGFTTDADLLTPWLTDWRGRFTGKAAALVSPATTDEVSQVIKIAAQHRIAIVPQGGNSGMVAGATPDDSGDQILLSLRRMDHIESIDADTQLATVQAGVILQNLHSAAHKHSLRFPLTLGGKGSATIGGLIACNAGGTQVLRHGTMRALVVGVEAVLPDGSIFNAMAPLKKDNRGYDLKHLLIGSEGTIAVITRAVVKLVPELIDRCAVWAGVDSPQQAYRLLRFMETQAGFALEGFEILPARALHGVLRHIEGTRAPLSTPHEWHILIELVQDRDSQIAPSELATDLMARAMDTGLIADAVLSTSQAQANAFWHIRDTISIAERADGPAVQHDISVPVAAMADFITRESPDIETRFPGTQVVAFGHLGDGNIHYHVKAPHGVDEADWFASYSKPISNYVYDRVAAYGGSLSAEHGIGQMKRDEFARLSEPARLNATRAIKAAFDPLGIMNPGKLIG